MTPEEQKPIDPALPPGFEQKVAECAQAYEAHRDADAERIMFEMLALAAAHARAEPTPEITWQTLADECEAAGNWAGALDARQKVLELAKAHSNLVYAMRPHLQLAGLYEMTGKTDEALAHIDAALAVAEQSDIPALLLMALEVKFASGLGRRDPAAIRASAAKGLAATGQERIFNNSKARFNLVIAGCSVELGELAAAEQHLDAAQQILGDSESGSFLPGRQLAQASAAEVRAGIHAARGQHAEAVCAFMEAVERGRTLGSCSVRGKYRLAKTLRRFADHLHAAEKSKEAAAMRAQSERMLQELKL